jgi:subtilisin family serine protease
MNRPFRLLATASIAAAALVAGSFGTAGASTRPAAPATAAAPHIVRFADSVDPRNEVALLRQSGLGIGRVFENVFPGAVVQGTPQQIEALRRNPRVASVEPDAVVRLSTTQDGATWGLDRIDQRALPLSSTYTYAAGPAAVTAYVVDTGILASHSEFDGRVGAGYTSIADGRGTSDCNGHGTHVAGTIGGTVFGVAKNVNLVPVRVLDCNGSGSWSGVIAGLDWIAAHHVAGTPAVANMSLGGGASSSVDAAVQAVIADGVTVVVAAGNSNVDACTSSPARVVAAITVAASDSTDTRASFSNFGSCVDVFAPGVAITAAWSNGGTNTISGTSMASPHVAGAAALILSASSSSTPTDVTSRLLGAATSNIVKNAGN